MYTPFRLRCYQDSGARVFYKNIRVLYIEKRGYYHKEVFL